MPKRRHASTNNAHGRPKMIRQVFNSTPQAQACRTTSCKCGVNTCETGVGNNTAPSPCPSTPSCCSLQTELQLQRNDMKQVVTPQNSSVHTSASSSSVQIDSAFACKCSECLTYSRLKKARRSPFSRSTCNGAFRCIKLDRQHSTSGMGDCDDADKPYIADRYRLKYGGLCLLDVSYFAPKFGFEHLRKSSW